jgi:hypothetical protein
LYGAFVWAHSALNGRKRRFSARARERKHWRWDHIATQLSGRTAGAAKAHWAASPHLHAEATRQQAAKAEERARAAAEERHQALMALMTPGASDLRW